MYEKERDRFVKYKALLKSANILVYEYHPATDTAISLDDDLREKSRVNGYMAVLGEHNWVAAGDMDDYVQFIRSISDGQIELTSLNENGVAMLKSIRKIKMTDEETGEEYLLLSKKDVTVQHNLERKYREQAYCDSLTKLYNKIRGRELVNAYLQEKHPYESCAFLVMDIDYFKGVNDSYGHLFGDKVLIAMAQLLLRFWKDNGIVIRVGGDEFAVLAKDMDNTQLITRINEFMKHVRLMTFEENDYTPTCSIGVCYVPHNTPNCTYEQVFGNADWALYQAKRQGRNRYAFCDNFRRYAEKKLTDIERYKEIDARYFQNDILATAFEIFEKSISISEAVNLLLRIIGIRFQIDRISIIRTDIKNNVVSCAYQWCADGVEKALASPKPFTREDFLTYFNSYDEYDTVVLNYDRMEGYSPQARALLMQKDAKTTLYTAMYDEGRYIGGISFAVCSHKRFWSQDRRRELSAVTKIITAYLSRSSIVNAQKYGTMQLAEYDSITGLISFARFRELVEHIIVGNTTGTYVMVYSDFENFTAYNREYGYGQGDRLLKEFADYIIGTTTKLEETYFSRIVSDQFVLFMPYDMSTPDVDYKVKRLNDAFITSAIAEDCHVNLRVRTGIYPVLPGCSGVSEAIDGANHARKQIMQEDAMNVIVHRC